jgi:hypothetical protein
MGARTRIDAAFEEAVAGLDAGWGGHVLLFSVKKLTVPGEVLWE